MRSLISEELSKYIGYLNPHTHTHTVLALSENVAAAGEIFREYFVTVQEHSIAYCRCREAVKLFRFLLSPYSLIGTCNSVIS
jgi:hypothetical protein